MIPPSPAPRPPFCSSPTSLISASRGRSGPCPGRMAEGRAVPSFPVTWRAAPRAAPRGEGSAGLEGGQQQSRAQPGAPTSRTVSPRGPAAPCPAHTHSNKAPLSLQNKAALHPGPGTGGPCSKAEFIVHQQLLGDNGEKAKQAQLCEGACC